MLRHRGRFRPWSHPHELTGLDIENLSISPMPGPRAEKPMPSIARPSTAIVACLLWLICSFATGKEDQASRYFDDGRARLVKGDVEGAIIQFRNALQEDPKLLAAKALLGTAYVRDLRPDLALETLEGALRMGIDKSEVAIPLAESLLMLGRPEDVLDRLPAELFEGPSKARLLVLRAQAYKQKNDLTSAAQALEQARSLDPRSTNVLLSLAEIQATRGLRQDSIALVDRATDLEPTNPRCWYMKGMVLQMAGDPTGAIQAFGKALDILPKYLDARIARLALAMSAKDTPMVKADVDFLAKEHPNEPRANYLRAVYLGLRGDDEGVRAALQSAAKVLSVMPPELMKARAPEMLKVAALVFHGLDEPERARAYLESVLIVNPGDVQAIKVLGAIYLQKQDYPAALRLLEPAESLAPRDPELLLLLGQAYLGRGRAPMAANMLQRAFQAAGNRADTQTAFGLTLMRSGRRDEGVQQLRAAFAKDPGQPQAGMALAIAHLGTRDFKSAVSVMERVVQRHPANPTYWNLIGIIKQAAGDGRGSRTAFERALQLAPGMITVAVNLAQVDVREGRIDVARSRIDAVLKADPKSAQAMLEMARFDQMQGRTQAALTWLERAYATDPGFLPGAIALVDSRVAAKEVAKAMDVIKELEGGQPDNLDVLAVSARTRLKLGDVPGAQSVLAKMTRLAQYDPARQVEVARLQLLAGNPSGADYSLEKALADRPDYLPALAMMVDVELARGQFASAEKRARAIIASHPQQGIGYRLMGGVDRTAGRGPSAIQQFKAAFAREPSTDNALLVYVTLMEGGGVKEAVAFLEPWVAKRPNDITATQALSEGYIRLGNYPAAKAKLEAAVRARPDDAGLLNNLASVTALTGNRTGALAYAEKCVKMAPDDPNARDTLGWLLAQSGSLESGLRHLREARLRDPRNPEIRYHLAAALRKAGRDQEARDEMKDAIGKPFLFPEAADADALARSLGLR